MKAPLSHVPVLRISFHRIKLVFVSFCSLSNSKKEFLTILFAAPKKFMIYSQKNLAMRLLPDSSDCSEAVLPIQGLKGVKAIDFDPEDQYLYWVCVIMVFVFFVVCFLKNLIYNN